MRFVLGWLVAAVTITTASSAWLTLKLQSGADLFHAITYTGIGGAISIGLFTLGAFAIATALCRTWPRLWPIAFPLAGIVAALAFPPIGTPMDAAVPPILLYGIPVAIGAISGLAGGWIARPRPQAPF